MEARIVILALIALSVATWLISKKHMRDARLGLAAKLRKQYGMSPNKKYTSESVQHIAKYFEAHREQDALDDITWNDMSMDDVYARINYCQSAAGEEVLYHLLRHPVHTRDEAETEEKISLFMEESDLRVKAQLLFYDMRQTSRYSVYDHLNSLDKERNTGNFPHYAPLVVMVLCIAGCFYRFTPFFILLLLTIVFNIISYYKEKAEIDAYLATFQYMLRLIEGSLSLAALLSKAPASPLFDASCERIRAKASAMRAFRRGSVIALSSARATGGSPLDLVMDYLRIATHIDLIVFNRMYAHLLSHVADVDALFTETGLTESWLSVACYRASLKDAYCRPVFHEETTLTIESGYHPLLMQPVENTIVCDKNVLLTGSNASGKSTFLKTCGIAAVMAQTLQTVCAKNYAAPRYRIYSSMALNDNILEGDSYYIVEIKSLKRILDAASAEGLRVLCFIDEVLSGTNTLERIAASAQILMRFCKSNVQCFAATHDGELTGILEDRYDNYHFDGEITDGDVHFDYLLRPGSATTRNAIRLLRMMGYDTGIVDEAESMAARFLETGVWTS